jgi:hypothetical protein
MPWTTRSDLSGVGCGAVGGELYNLSVSGCFISHDLAFHLYWASTWFIGFLVGACWVALPLPLLLPLLP